MWLWEPVRRSSVQPYGHETSVQYAACCTPSSLLKHTVGEVEGIIRFRLFWRGRRFTLSSLGTTWPLPHGIQDTTNDGPRNAMLGRF